MRWDSGFQEQSINLHRIIYMGRMWTSSYCIDGGAQTVCEGPNSEHLRLWGHTVLEQVQQRAALAVCNHVAVFR